MEYIFCNLNALQSHSEQARVGVCVWQSEWTSIFCVFVHAFFGCNICTGEGVFMWGRLWVCVCAGSWFKCMFAPIHTVYTRLQFQVRVRFIAVKYSVTTTNYNTDCVISRQSCNYSAGSYLKPYTLNFLLPGADSLTAYQTHQFTRLCL